MEVICVVAMALNRAIGIGGKLPWRLPGDLKHFRSITLGYTVIMGRLTFESISKPLSERRNIVVSRTLDAIPNYPNTHVTKSLADAIALCRERDAEKAFIIGGSELYRAAIDSDIVDRIEMTLVKATPNGDVFFPALNAANWRIREGEKAVRGEQDQFPYSFVTLTRRR